MWVGRERAREGGHIRTFQTVKKKICRVSRHQERTHSHPLLVASSGTDLLTLCWACTTAPDVFCCCPLWPWPSDPSGDPDLQDSTRLRWVDWNLRWHSSTYSSYCRSSSWAAAISSSMLEQGSQALLRSLWNRPNVEMAHRCCPGRDSWTWSPWNLRREMSFHSKSHNSKITLNSKITKTETKNE